MRFIFIHSPSGAYVDADHARYQACGFPDNATLTTPKTIHVAGTEAEAAALAGLTATPPHPEPVPDKVAGLQIKVWFVRNGHGTELITDIIDSIADEAQREEARLRWEYAVDIPRDHPLVTAFAAALQWDAETVDNVFREAAKL